MKNEGAISLERPWAWTGTDLVLDRYVEEDGGLEQLWICPDLPDAWQRLWYPRGVELLYYVSDVTALNEVLGALSEQFQRDSVLAAVYRKPATSDVLLYSTANSDAIYERTSAVRRALRLCTAGIRVREDDRWKGLERLLSSAEKKGPAQ